MDFDLLYITLQKWHISGRFFFKIALKKKKKKKKKPKRIKGFSVELCLLKSI